MYWIITVVPLPSGPGRHEYNEKKTNPARPSGRLFGHPANRPETCIIHVKLFKVRLYGVWSCFGKL